MPDYIKITLTRDEYKELVQKIAIQIAPMMIEKKITSEIAAVSTAQYAADIADAVADILKYGNTI